jgi:hypothetical protein
MSASEILQQSRKDCAALPAIIIIVIVITIDPRFRDRRKRVLLHGLNLIRKLLSLNTSGNFRLTTMVCLQRLQYPASTSRAR